MLSVNYSGSAFENLEAVVAPDTDGKSIMSRIESCYTRSPAHECKQLCATECKNYYAPKNKKSFDFERNKKYVTPPKRPEVKH